MALPIAVLDTPGPYAAPRPGLVDAAVGPMDMPAHVQTSGAQWLNEVCGGGQLYPPACLTPPYPSFRIDPGDGMVTAYPFVTAATYICPPVGTSDADAERRVRQRLTLDEPRQVERAFWGGGDGVTGVLEQMFAAIPASVTQLAASPTIPEGIAKLEQQATVNGYNGPLLIHARPRMAALGGARGAWRTMLTSDNGIVHTWYGSRVVFGSGYKGSKTDGSGGIPTATVDAVYITGRVFLWREPQIQVSPPQQMLITGTGSGGTNQRVMIATRAWAAAVECFAATTDVTVP
jgi:hypothetical protein